MAPELERIARVKAAAEQGILKRPGVTGIDVGYKFVGGRRTDEVAIRVFVAEKRVVAPGEEIPAAIDGVRTDVIQYEAVIVSDTKPYRPLRGGIMIGPNRSFPSPWPESKSGTLGIIALDNASGRPLMLSNFHVMCVDNDWDKDEFHREIGQPGPFRDIDYRIVGRVERGILDEEVDAAVASMNTADRTTCWFSIEEIGNITGIRDPELGLAVRKRGAATGLTSGTIDGQIGTVKQVDHGPLGKRWIGNVFHVSTDGFADHGDSGSVLVDDKGRVVGLLISKDNEGNGHGNAIPIRTVLRKLDISLKVTIGGYDLASPKDRMFAFDHEGTGKLDHIVAYRPGDQTAWTLKNALRSASGGSFESVASSSQGIGTFDLKVDRDRLFAFDYEGTGRLDHIVAYRPGDRACWILKHNRDGTFQKVLHSETGIGGYDLVNGRDRLFAFDYEGTGKLDHIVAYRPGAGTIWIMKIDRVSNFTIRISPPVYKSDSGLGGFDLADPRDRLFAFDFAGSGKLDHIVAYRPGAGDCWILERDFRNLNFRSVYRPTANQYWPDHEPVAEDR